MSAEFQAYIDQVVKTLASKEDINSLKVLINDQNQLIRSLDLKVLKLEEKVEENNFTIKNLEEKVSKLEGDQKFLNEQDDLRCRKIDDLEHYGRRECLRFDRFEVSDAESTADCCKIVKDYIKHELKVELNDDDYYRIHRIGLKRDKNGNKYQQSIVHEFKNFLSRTQVYRARKRKAKISVRLDLTKRRSDLRNSAYQRVREHPKINFVCADINCSLCVCLRGNGGFKYFNTMEELEKIFSDLSD